MAQGEYWSQLEIYFDSAGQLVARKSSMDDVLYEWILGSGMRIQNLEDRIVFNDLVAPRPLPMMPCPAPDPKPGPVPPGIG